MRPKTESTSDVLLFRKSSLSFQLKFLTIVVIFCVLIINASSVMSHHGRTNFLYDETITLEGKVIEFNWRNPHSYIEIQVVNQNNVAENWLIEGGTIVSSKKHGWKKDSIKAGDNAIAVGFPDKNTKKNLILLEHIVLADGKTLYLSTTPPHILRARGITGDCANFDKSIECLIPGSKLSADKPVVTPSKDYSGTWDRSPGNGVKTGYALFTPPSNWPLTQLGEAELAKFNDLENPWFECLERGLPFYSLYPYFHQWTRFEDRIEIISQQSTLVRTLYLNQDTHPDQIEPSHAGHSIAHIDDDGSLVVDTIGFPDFVKWGIAAGVDASGQKRIREHYSLSEDGLDIAVSITIEDPVYLTEPVTINGSDRKVADIPFEPYDCDVDIARKHLSAPLKTP